MKSTLSTNLILFDLDDTLFDHERTLRAALHALRTQSKQVATVQLEVLVKAHWQQVYAHYDKVLDAQASANENRRFRFKAMLTNLGISMNEAELLRCFEIYISAYYECRSTTKGAAELLSYLKPLKKIGVVTNGVETMQREKLEFLGLLPLVDFLLTSEKAGVKKPQPDIFMQALALGNVSASQTLFVGDSWDADVQGATAVGIRCLWLNRHNAPCPDPNLANEVATLEPKAQLLNLIG